jgi:hypothetical protein
MQKSISSVLHMKAKESADPPIELYQNHGMIQRRTRSRTALDMPMMFMYQFLSRLLTQKTAAGMYTSITIEARVIP